MITNANYRWHNRFSFLSAKWCVFFSFVDFIFVFCFCLCVIPWSPIVPACTELCSVRSVVCLSHFLRVSFTVLKLNSLPVLGAELCVSSIFLCFYFFRSGFSCFFIVCDCSRETLTTIQRDTQTLISIAPVSVWKICLTIDSVLKWGKKKKTTNTRIFCVVVRWRSSTAISHDVCQCKNWMEWMERSAAMHAQ